MSTILMSLMIFIIVLSLGILGCVLFYLVTELTEYWIEIKRNRLEREWVEQNRIEERG